MSDSVTQANIVLFENLLGQLKETSAFALERGVNFVRIQHAFRELRPYIDNFRLFANEHLGTKLNLLNETPAELMALANDSRKKITVLHKALSEKLPLKENNINIFSEKSLRHLGELLTEIDKQPYNQAVLNRYFMRGTLETAGAIALFKRDDTDVLLSDDIDETEISEEVLSALEAHGISIDDDAEDAVYDIIYDECHDAVMNKNTQQSKSLSHAITDSLHEYFKVDMDFMQPVIDGYNESLSHIVSGVKTKLRQNKQNFFELEMFAQNIPFIPHEEAERMIFQSKVPFSVQEVDYTLSSRKPLPEYLQSYADDERLISVRKEMPHWEKYETEAQKFNKPQVYEQMKNMAIIWLGCMYENLDDYADRFDEIRKKHADNEDEETNKALPLSGEEKDFINFIGELLEVAEYSHKYIGLQLNKTGVRKDTADMLLKKASLTETDLNLLDEVLSDIGQNMEDNSKIFLVESKIEFSDALKALKAMPHGKERQEGLYCLHRTLMTYFSNLYDEAEAYLFDIDSAIGHSLPEADNALKDFVESSAGQFSDLTETTDEIIENLHKGVLTAWVIPAYQKLKPNGQETEVSVMYFDDYPTYQPETQQYLRGLAKYYGGLVMKEHRALIKSHKYSEELDDMLYNYNEVHLTMQEVDNLNEKVEQELNAEQEISSAYDKYRRQKEEFELPKNFDLMLAAGMYGRGR